MLEIALVTATLAGGVWAVIAAVRWVQRRLSKAVLPTYSAEELRRRLRVLAVDDQGFTYSDDFSNDGYGITTKTQLTSFGDVEGYEYDLLILDIRGIAPHLSRDDGLGVMRHVREHQESMAIIVYSAGTYDLSVDRSAADHTVDVASGDYASFRDAVDDLFRRMTDVEFYLRNFDSSHGSAVAPSDRDRLAVVVESTLIDPSVQPPELKLSSHTTSTRAAEIVRHAQATSLRLHRKDPSG